jgi:signal transduction histidine kinase/predicted transcriptional regulator
MVDVPRRSARELDTALTNIKQTISLLRSQAQAGRMDPSYVDQRLSAVEKVVEEVTEERKHTVQQERLAKLYEVSRVIGSSLDLQTVLDQVMDAIIQLTVAERGFLMLQDDDGNLNVRVARNFDQETLNSNAFALSRTVTRNVMENGQAIVTTNAQEDPRFAGQASVIAHGLRSIMASPLRVRGQVIGVVYVDNRVHSGLFVEKDLEVLDAFAGQAAVAIDNARLFSATDQLLNARVEELTMLQRMDRQLNETLDTAKAMNVTLEWSSRVCGAQSASMGLLDPASQELRVVSHYGEPDMLSGNTTGETAQIDHTHPLVQKAIQTQEPALERYEGDPAGAIFVVPVRREGKVVGVIAMTAIGENVFQEDARGLVSRMADRAAIAIENGRLYDAVQAANKAKSEFVSLVAHELKVPMTSIQGYADLMGIAGPVNERQSQFVQTIKNAVNRMKVLVSDLSDISRIESGHLQVTISEVSLVDAINAATEGTMSEIERHQHKLVVNVDPALPQVHADKDRLSQVLLNLISNAYKYTPDGGTITLQTRLASGEVAISITDTGVGMSAEQVAKLGTKFWRADNGLQQPGTGLGFAITRNLIELMRGKLSIESEPGKGSTFTVAFPVAS